MQRVSHKQLALLSQRFCRFAGQFAEGLRGLGPIMQHPGVSVGAREGWIVGSSDGERLGKALGWSDGVMDGISLGERDGRDEGTLDGAMEGAPVFSPKQALPAI